MKQQVSGVVVGVVIVLAVVLIAFLGYRYLGGAKRNVTPEEQMRMMQNMKKGG